jgi:hypothetical protein
MQVEYRDRMLASKNASHVMGNSFANLQDTRYCFGLSYEHNPRVDLSFSQSDMQAAKDNSLLFYGFEFRFGRFGKKRVVLDCLIEIKTKQIFSEIPIQKNKCRWVGIF